MRLMFFGRLCRRIRVERSGSDCAKRRRRRPTFFDGIATISQLRRPRSVAAGRLTMALLLSRFVGETEATVAVITAFATIPLVFLIGAGIDYGIAVQRQA